MLGKIAKERGQTLHQVLWDDSWLNLQLYEIDAPRYVKGKPPVPIVESLDELRKLRGDN